MVLNRRATQRARMHRRLNATLFMNRAIKLIKYEEFVNKIICTTGEGLVRILRYFAIKITGINRVIESSKYHQSSANAGREPEPA